MRDLRRELSREPRPIVFGSAAHRLPGQLRLPLGLAGYREATIQGRVVPLTDLTVKRPPALRETYTEFIETTAGLSRVTRLKHTHTFVAPDGIASEWCACGIHRNDK